MARHNKQTTASAALLGGAQPALPGAPLWTPEVDPNNEWLVKYLLERSDHIVVRDERIKQAAASLIAYDPAVTDETNRLRFKLACEVYNLYVELVGTLDTTEALRRSHVDLFLSQFSGADMDASYRAYRSHLYRYGRMLHPREYPQPPRTGPIQRVQNAYSRAEVRKFYTDRIGLGPILQPRFTTMLDLTTGAGARSQELIDLTGSVVRAHQTDMGQVVTVDLTSRSTGLIRTVPVLDRVKAARIRRRAEEVGPDGHMLQYRGKNMVNRIQRDAQRAGVNIEFKAVRLRNTWIREMAQLPIPAMVLMEMADIGDTDTLHHLTKGIPPQDPVAAAVTCGWVIA